MYLTERFSKIGSAARFAVPEKIIGLTLFLDFFDRCTALGSLLPPPAAQVVSHRWCGPGLRCPKKSSGLRFSSIFSTAALRSGRSSRHWRRSPRLPTSYARRTHTPDGSCEACCHNQKRTPSGWMVFFFGCGGRTRTYDLRVMSPTSFQLLYSAIWGALLRCLGIVPRLSRFVKMFFLQSFGKGCRVFPELAS